MARSRIILILAIAVLIAGAGGVFGAGKVAGYLEARTFAKDKQLNDYYHSVQDREAKIKANPDDWDAYVSLGFNWKSIGDLTQNKKYYRRAIKAYERAISHFEKSGKKGYVVYLNAANLYRYLGKFENAETRYRQAIEIDPGEPMLYVKLADLYRNEMKKKPEEIINFYKFALTRLISTGPLIQDYASYLKEIGRIQDALIYYNLLADSNPDQPQFKKIADELREQLKQKTQNPNSEN